MRAVPRDISQGSDAWQRIRLIASENKKSLGGSETYVEFSIW